MNNSELIHNLDVHNSLVIPKSNSKKTGSGTFLEYNNDNIIVKNDNKIFFISENSDDSDDYEKYDDYSKSSLIKNDMILPKILAENQSAFSFDISKDTLFIEFKKKHQNNFFSTFYKIIECAKNERKMMKIKKIIITTPEYLTNTLFLSLRRIYKKQTVVLGIENKIIIDKLKK